MESVGRERRGGREEKSMEKVWCDGHRPSRGIVCVMEGPHLKNQKKNGEKKKEIDGKEMHHKYENYGLCRVEDATMK